MGNIRRFTRNRFIHNRCEVPAQNISKKRSKFLETVLDVVRNLLELVILYLPNYKCTILIKQDHALYKS